MVSLPAGGQAGSGGPVVEAGQLDCCSHLRAPECRCGPAHQFLGPAAEQATSSERTAQGRYRPASSSPSGTCCCAPSSDGYGTPSGDRDPGSTTTSDGGSSTRGSSTRARGVPCLPRWALGSCH